MVLVDSSVWIEATRRNGALEVKVALEGLLNEFEAALCAPVWLEVLGGARAQERGRMKKYFEVLPFLPMHPTVWQEAVELSWRLRDGGDTVPWNDVLIATLALKQGCRVYAVDGHFHTIAKTNPLRLYQPGYGGSYNPE